MVFRSSRSLSSWGCWRSNCGCGMTRDSRKSGPKSTTHRGKGQKMGWPERDGITVEYFPVEAIPDQYRFYFEKLFGSSASSVAGELSRLSVWVGDPAVVVDGVCACDGYGQGPTIEELARTTWVWHQNFQRQEVRDFFVVDVLPQPCTRSEGEQARHVVGARCNRCGMARLWFEAPEGVPLEGRWTDAHTLGL